MRGLWTLALCLMLGGCITSRVQLVPAGSEDSIRIDLTDWLCFAAEYTMGSSEPRYTVAPCDVPPAERPRTARLTGDVHLMELKDDPAGWIELPVKVSDTVIRSRRVDRGLLAGALRNAGMAVMVKTGGLTIESGAADTIRRIFAEAVAKPEPPPPAEDPMAEWPVLMVKRGEVAAQAETAPAKLVMRYLQ